MLENGPAKGYRGGHIFQFIYLVGLIACRTLEGKQYTPWPLVVLGLGLGWCYTVVEWDGNGRVTTVGGEENIGRFISSTSIWQRCCFASLGFSGLLWAAYMRSVVSGKLDGQSAPVPNVWIRGIVGPL
ncbi:unnamed protein product [Discosporangium mesarthrocarpum]